MKLRMKQEALEHPESHPARGAWIEIFISTRVAISAIVAPRKGCVD